MPSQWINSTFFDQVESYLFTLTKPSSFDTKSSATTSEISFNNSHKFQLDSPLIQLLPTLTNMLQDLHNSSKNDETPIHHQLHKYKDMDSILEKNLMSSPSLIPSELPSDILLKIINVLKNILLILTSNQRSNNNNVKIIINLLKQKPNRLSKPPKNSSKHNNYLHNKSCSSTPHSSKQKRNSPQKK